MCASYTEPAAGRPVAHRDAAPADEAAANPDVAPLPQPWDQQPGEPDRWFGRFQIFLQLGPTRTLRAAYQGTRRGAGDPQAPAHGFANHLWCNAARSWHWRARAAAWDVHQRDLFALGEYNARLARRQRRLALIEEQLERVCTALEQAGIDNLDLHEARTLFPQTRVYLRDLLAAERLEDAGSLLDPADPDSAVLITADDLIAAQRQLEAMQREGALDHPAPGPARDRQLPAVAPPARASVRAPAPPAVGPLFVCAAPGCALGLDLVAWRSVRAASGLQFQRVLGATRRKFAEHLRRERGLHRPLDLLHLAVPASTAGLQFAGDLADGDWLIARLAGVRIMLLAPWTGALVVCQS